MELIDAEKLCVCPQCPTYFDCDEPRAFCLYDEGASSCIRVKNGCICGGCPVQNAEGFTWMYYCTDGNAKARAGS